jgi:hypothetical protein
MDNLRSLRIFLQCHVFWNMYYIAQISKTTETQNYEIWNIHESFEPITYSWIVVYIFHALGFYRDLLEFVLILLYPVFKGCHCEKHEIEQACSSGNSSVPVRISAGTSTVLTEILHIFLQYLQENARMAKISSFHIFWRYTARVPDTDFTEIKYKGVCWRTLR